MVMSRRPTLYGSAAAGEVGASHTPYRQNESGRRRLSAQHYLARKRLAAALVCAPVPFWKKRAIHRPDTRIEWQIEVNGGDRTDVEEQMRRLRAVRRVCEERTREMADVVMRAPARRLLRIGGGLETARVLGIKIPNSILLRADNVIE